MNLPDKRIAYFSMEIALDPAMPTYSGGLLYLCFPHAAHDEKAWGMRLHLPMQLFTGIVARASRSSDQEINANPG